MVKEKFKPEVLVNLILDFGKVLVSSNKLMTSGVDKIEQIKIKNMDKYENHFEKMDDVINKLEKLSDVKKILLCIVDLVALYQYLSCSL